MVTKKEHLKQLAEQGNCCFICRTPFTGEWRQCHGGRYKVTPRINKYGSIVCHFCKKLTDRYTLDELTRMGEYIQRWADRNGVNITKEN
jgi:hypothetical protein